MDACQLNNPEIVSPSIKDSFKMTFYLFFFEKINMCSCFNTNNKEYQIYKNLQNRFRSELNCEELLPKINYSYLVIKELLDNKNEK